MNTKALSDSDLAFHAFQFQRAIRHIGWLGHAGHTRIANLAAHAVNAGDKFLGAAILTRLDAIPSREQELTSVVREELEKAIYDKDVRKARDAITLARNRAIGVRT